jgi:hypothetical protein
MVEPGHYRWPGGLEVVREGRERWKVKQDGREFDDFTTFRGAVACALSAIKTRARLSEDED